MNSEFDDFEHDLEDLENSLPDFELEYEDFPVEMPEFEINVGEIDFSNINARTAVLSKNNMFALLCLKTASEGGAICRVDPREMNPAVQTYDDPEKAAEWFAKSLNTSKKNGWNVVYDGLPLEG